MSSKPASTGLRACAPTSASGAGPDGGAVVSAEIGWMSWRLPTRLELDEFLRRAMGHDMSTKESDDAEVRPGSRFHRLLGATLVSAIGTGMHAAALPLLALQSTRSPMALSLVVMAAEIPWVLLSLHAGVVVDRLDRRR